MSKLLYVVYKDSIKKPRNTDVNILETIEKRILPDNILPNKMELLKSSDSIGAIFNPVSTIKIDELSVCLGYSPNSNWSDLNLRGEDLEGSFGILRNKDTYFQIASDMVASRTIWYYMNDEVFVASTSQRAIVTYLGTFEFDERVIPWMLSSGTIGPGFSYDKRLEMVKPNTLLTLNKENWTLDEDVKVIELKNKFKNREEAKSALVKTLENTFHNLDLDYDKIVLPLSGGYDSRGILLFLKNKIGLKTITWGAKESRQQKANDAYIAKELAHKLSVENHFFESFSTDVPIQEVLNRFLICSEGRIDHIGGYLDGMNMWKHFFESKFETIIRGEELIGLSIVKSIFNARREEGISLLNDYFNVDKAIIERLEKQEIPFSEQHIDNIYIYKGNLAINYEHPIKFAALNDIKLAYTEVFSPLLSSSIIKVIATMFDEKIIGDKELFKEIVNDRCPDIPIAQYGANKQMGDIFYSDKITKEFISTFNNALENNIINKELIEYTLGKIRTKPNHNKLQKKNFTSIARKLFPKTLLDLIKSKSSKREMNWPAFAFRLYILIKMKELFLEDSKVRSLE